MNGLRRTSFAIGVCLLRLGSIATLGVTTAVGQTWQESNGPEGGNVLAFETNASGDMFAAVEGGGVYESNDGGDTWTRAGLPGEYQVTFEAENLPSGLYLYRLKAGEASRTHKMLLQK